MGKSADNLTFCLVNTEYRIQDLYCQWLTQKFTLRLHERLRHQEQSRGSDRVTPRKWHATSGSSRQLAEVAGNYYQLLRFNLVWKGFSPSLPVFTLCECFSQSSLSANLSSSVNGSLLQLAYHNSESRRGQFSRTPQKWNTHMFHRSMHLRYKQKWRISV